MRPLAAFPASTAHALPPSREPRDLLSLHARSSPAHRARAETCRKKTDPFDRCTIPHVQRPLRPDHRRIGRHDDDTHLDLRPDRPVHRHHRLQSFSNIEAAYLDSVKGRATQTEVRQELGAPKNSRKSDEERRCGSMKSGEQQAGNRYTAPGIWCEEYLLTFDGAAVLQKWKQVLTFSRRRTHADGMYPVILLRNNSGRHYRKASTRCLRHRTGMWERNQQRTSLSGSCHNYLRRI